MTFFRTRTYFKTGLAAAALAAASLAFSAPAAAHGRRGGDDAAIAIGAGVLGLAIGAAIASDDNNQGYYDTGYNDQGYYPAYPPYRGYAYPAYPAYRGAYPAYPVYQGGYDWRYDQARRWREHRRWDRRRGWRGW